MTAVQPDPPASLSLHRIRTRGVMVPLRFALGTSAAVVREVPLVLVDLQMHEGPAGRAYVFAYSRSGAAAIAAHLAEMADLLGPAPVTPFDANRRLARRLDLIGLAGPVRMALSALDIALWDAAAQALGVPLARMLGAAPRPIPAYDSRGLGLMAPGPLADEAEALLQSGLGAVKLRLGYPTLADDLAAVAAVRDRLPDGCGLMVDYNQALTPAEALRRGLALQDHDLTWLEEPIRHGDLAGAAALARRLDLPVQLGENFNGPEDMAAALSACACDLAMPDVARIGGVTGWMQAAGMAAAARMPLSSHLMPEISLHLLSASPTAHWVEYVDWADAVLAQPVALADGCALTPDRPGIGLDWDEDRIARLATC